MFAVIQHDHFEPKDSAEIDREVRGTGEGGWMVNRTSIGMAAAALLTVLTLGGNASAEDARLGLGTLFGGATNAEEGRPGPAISPGGTSQASEDITALQEKIVPDTRRMELLTNAMKIHREIAREAINNMR